MQTDFGPLVSTETVNPLGLWAAAQHLKALALHILSFHFDSCHRHAGDPSIHCSYCFGSSRTSLYSTWDSEAILSP